MASGAQKTCNFLEVEKKIFGRKRFENDFYNYVQEY